MNKYTCCSSSPGRSDPVGSSPFKFPVSFSPVRLCVCVSVRQARLSRVFSRDSIDVSYPYYTLTCITATSSSRSTCSFVAVKTKHDATGLSARHPPRAPRSLRLSLGLSASLRVLPRLRHQRSSNDGESELR